MFNRSISLLIAAPQRVLEPQIDEQDMVFYDSARSEVNILNMNKTQFETHRSMSLCSSFTDRFDSCIK
jgi:hypothetical protein